MNYCAPSDTFAHYDRKMQNGEYIKLNAAFFAFNVNNKDFHMIK